MSTAATITDTVATLPVKKETVVFAVVFEVDEHGAPVRDSKGNVKAPRHTSNENDIKNLEDAAYPKTDAEKKTPEKIAFKQPVFKPVVGTLDGFSLLIADKDEQLNIINKGVSSKFNQKIKTKLTEQNEDGSLVFQPTDTVFDATELVQEQAQRVFLSPEEKIKRAITASGLSPEALAGIIAAMQSAASTGNAVQTS